MSQIKLAGTAFRNMARAAANDPIWAIVALCMSPLRAFKHVVGSIILLGLVGMIVAVVGDLLLAPFGLPKQAVRAAVTLVVIAVLLPLAFRLITRPMIHHFGNMEGDTHGSARFATHREVAPLVRADSGLLIGREAKTGKPLRYNGPAHLLTMAPTRTGKGVGTIIPNLLSADRSVICIDPKGENAKITQTVQKLFG